MKKEYRILSFNEYKDKLEGCWAGKNIGGVLGMPFEGFRAVNKIDFYAQDLSQGAPANDDLDLQIVWLAAVERYGRNVNASILGEYWLSYITPNWLEYGMGKTNMRSGLRPPLSGEVDNPYKNSCGCFIRAELWACLAPGNPDIAARYAYEDAIVDHAGEGMYGEIFVAALESAAFVESDCRTLIDIGLSYIPEDCAVARAIKEAIYCYDHGIDFYEARKRIHNLAPGSFGIRFWTLDEIPEKDNEGMKIGTAGFDAPENIAFSIAGWLYGEGDFGRSLCLTNSCGEDTDCTCATLGAILGIIHGNSGLPQKWKEPLNDKIVTCCIDKSNGGIWIPKTTVQLADRIMRNIPQFLGVKLCDIFAEGGMSIRCKIGKDLYCKTGERHLYQVDGMDKDEALSICELCNLSPYVVRYDFTAFTVYVDYEGSVTYRKGENRKIKVRVVNSHTLNNQHYVKISAFPPKGAEICGSSSVELSLNLLMGIYAETEFEINTDEYLGSRLEMMLDVSLIGRHSSGPIKVVLHCEH